MFKQTSRQGYALLELLDPVPLTKQQNSDINIYVW